MLNRPNILYIHSHDTGRYIQPYGHAVPTPHLQRLAEQGILFRQNFCINPTCSPSRAALLTGCYPHENGMTGLAHRGWSLNDYRQHIVHMLRDVGYPSVQTGVQHLAGTFHNPEAYKTIGYDRHLAGEPHEAAADFLQNAPDQPFFLAVGFFETHLEFPALAESPDDPRYCRPPAPLPDTPQTREDMARYKASARLLDTKIGAVLDALEQSGLADNTLVICTTDHGIPFPQIKCNLRDAGIGTMLIIRDGRIFQGGVVIDSMTTHLDIFPTICDLLEIEPPAWLRGKSLLPLIQGDTNPLHKSTFFQLNYHAAYEPVRAVRTQRWKYIRRFGERTTPVLSNCDNSASKSLWLDHGWQAHELKIEQLFDLLFDPHEMRNLAEDVAFRPILQTLRDQLDQWMQHTNDPLRHGNVPAPATALVNHPDALSPKEPTYHPNAIR